jgi:alpha-tubulin suppressor-like RCC1 family protein
VADAVHIAVASDGTACAIRRGGAVACWRADDAPSAIPDVRGATEIVLGETTACAATAGGLACWKRGEPLLRDADDVTGGAFGRSLSCLLVRGHVVCGHDGRWRQIEGLGRERAVAKGEGHACALRDDGSVRCFGEWHHGERGDGVVLHRTQPKRVGGIGQATRLSVGGTAACAQRADGTTSCWGCLADGIPGTASGRTTSPVEVPVLRDARSVAMGTHDLCAVSPRGDVACWGEQAKLAPGPLEGVLEIAIGGAGSCARTASDVRCWGYGRMGFLGRVVGSDEPMPAAPVPGVVGATKIAAGISAACALVADGKGHSLRCWGDTHYGLLGNGAPPTNYFVASPRPTRVVGLADVVSFTMGPWHACAVKKDGTAACWGHNSRGELGSTDRSETLEEPYAEGVPVAVKQLSGAIDVAAGGGASCALLADRTVKCWGSNSSGELGDGTTDQRLHPVPVRGLTGVVELGMGDDFGCARTNDGAVWCWGSDACGQIGDGAVAETDRAILVDLGPPDGAAGVACSGAGCR